MDKAIINKGLLTAVLSGALMVTASAADLKTEEQKLSYIFGLDIGRTLKAQGMEVNFKTLSAAIQTGFEGGETLMTEAEIDNTRQAFITRKTEEAQAKVAKIAGANATEGAAFLAGNAKKDGVITTASGLQYQVITAGKGAKPKAEETVTVHYRGTTLNGQEFDSSYKRNAPASFPLNRVIPGWTEGVQLMPVGSKYKFFIPSALAYGEQGSPPSIMPNSTLIFEVELISIGEAK
ncbi:MAG: FKBP-type peptidyl-prolyl cis-trans isomerase [Proteobacteria bacterium]|nr:FKBP-type peptidyl-prolyl cis-trans isomerase [Pseudomonadota bacterium]